MQQYDGLRIAGDRRPSYYLYANDYLYDCNITRAVRHWRCIGCWWRRCIERQLRILIVFIVYVLRCIVPNEVKESFPEEEERECVHKRVHADVYIVGRVCSVDRFFKIIIYFFFLIYYSFSSHPQ